MKRFFKLTIVTILAGVASAYSQEQPLAGFVFANGVGVAGKAEISANGKKLTKNGLLPGRATSGLGLPVGEYQIEVTAPGCQAGRASITIAAGTTPVVASYLEPKVDPQTKQTKNFIRLLQVPSTPQDGRYSITCISLDPVPQFSASAGGNTVTLQPRKPEVFESKSLKVTNAAGTVQSVSVDEKGSYYCFVFRKADGAPGTCLVPQRIYEW